MFPLQPEDTNPPVSYPQHCGSRRRSTSLSQVRGGIRRTGSIIQHHLEKTLGCMTRQDMELPGTSARGVMFHVPDMPGDHNRDSVCKALHQSVDWLRLNPQPGCSPFSPTIREQDTGQKPDLLDMETEYQQHPILQPLQSHRPQKPTSTESVDLSWELNGHSEEVDVEAERTAAPTPSGILIDVDIFPSVSPDSVKSPTPSDRSSTKTDSLHPDLISVSSAFHSKSDVQQCLPAILTIKKPAAFRSENRVQNIAAKFETTLSHGHEVVSDPQRPVSELPYHTSSFYYRNQHTDLRNSSLSNFKTEAPPHKYLGAGLRPVLPPPSIPTFSITPAPPATARYSTEVLDRKNAALALPGSSESYRKLSRKSNNRDLRATGKSQISRTDESLLKMVPEKIPKTIQIPAIINIAGRISKFEQPASSHIEEPTHHIDTDANKTQKRFAIYGSLSSPRQQYQPYRLPPQPQTNGGDTRTSNKSEGLAPTTYKPYRPGIVVAESSRDLASSRPRVSGLPVKRKNDELFLPPGSKSSNVASILAFLTVHVYPHDKIAIIADTDESNMRAVPDFDQTLLPPTPRTVARNGTLTQLGGRVLDTHQQPNQQPNQQPDHFDHQPHHQPDHQLDQPPSSTQDILLTSLQPSDEPDEKHYRLPAHEFRTSKLFESVKKSSLPISHFYCLPDSDSGGKSHPDQQQSSSAASNNAISIQQSSMLQPEKATDPSTLLPQISGDSQKWSHAPIDQVKYRKHHDEVIKIGSNKELIQRFEGRWQWKRFADGEWDDKERQRLRKKTGMVRSAVVRLDEKNR